MARKLNKPSDPKRFAAKLAKDYGPVTVVRAVVQTYPRLKRGEVLAIARDIGINEGTASRQYQEVRGPNKVRIAL